MKPLKKLRAADHDEAAVENVLEEWERRGTAAVGGWELSSGARANATVLARWFAWAVICAGPVLGLLAWMSSAAAVDAQPQLQPRAQQTETESGAGPTGFAELFVAAFVEAGQGEEDQLAPYYPSASQLDLDGAPARQTATQTTAVRVRQTAPGAWSVTVATRVEPHGTKDSKAKDAEADKERSGVLRYFQVPVLAQTPASSPSLREERYVAAALPAEVAAPGGQARQPRLGYGPERAAVPGDTRAETVREFLSAYLTGTGELDRYLAPGLHMEPVSPAPYRKVAIESMAVAGESADSPATRVPADGTQQRLLVQVRATGTDHARVPLSYALTLKARDGRWEIAAMDATPALATPRTPTTATTTPAA
ncbi:conjugal transfer protein [Streptomyces sp. NPDC021354]|uniref:conjugal transfer protein n=1 Tax=Streptomyces sp. NPDC021354 TaxID=3154793 RepID=UPI0033C6ED8A